MAAEDFVSLDQFGDAMNEPGAESPPRPTMNGEHLGPQFAGLIGSDETPKAVRHPHYIRANGPSVHEWLSGNRSRRDQ
jgi:hypothetical protein